MTNKMKIVMLFVIALLMVSCSKNQTEENNISSVENTTVNNNADEKNMKILQDDNIAKNIVIADRIPRGPSDMLTLLSDTDAMREIESMTFEPLSDDEEIGYDRKPSVTKYMYDIEFFATNKDGQKRSLAKVINSGMSVELFKEQKCIYFTAAPKDEVGRIFCIDGKNGVFVPLMDERNFDASDDGRYLCFYENSNSKKENNRLHSLIYLYDVYAQKIVDTFDFNKISVDTFEGINGPSSLHDTSVRRFDSENRCFIIVFTMENEAFAEYKFYVPDSPLVIISDETKISTGKHQTQDDFSALRDYDKIYDITLNNRAVQIYGKKKYSLPISDDINKIRNYQDEKILVLRDKNSNFMDALTVSMPDGFSYEGTFIDSNVFCMELRGISNNTVSSIVYTNNDLSEFKIFNVNDMELPLFFDNIFANEKIIMWETKNNIPQFGARGILKIDVSTDEIGFYKCNYFNLIENFGANKNGYGFGYRYIDILPVEATSALGCFECKGKWYVITETEIVEVAEEPAHGERKRLGDFLVM